MQITITINTDNAAFSGEDGPGEVARILDRIKGLIQVRDYLEPDTLTLRDINGNTCGEVRIEEDEPPALVRQTTCKYCDLDIENIRPAPGKAFPRGQWTDRGGNTSCNDGRHKHAPVPEE